MSDSLTERHSRIVRCYKIKIIFQGFSILASNSKILFRSKEKTLTLKELVEQVFRELEIHFEYKDETVFSFSILGKENIVCEAHLEIQKELNTFSVIVHYPKYIDKSVMPRYLDLFNLLNSSIDSTFVIAYKSRTILFKMNRFFNASSYRSDELCLYFNSNFRVMNAVLEQSQLIESGSTTSMEIVKLIDSTLNNA